MTPGTKVSLVLAVGLIALVGGYFLLVPDSGPNSETPDGEIGDDLVVEPETAEVGDGTGWREYEENWIEPNVDRDPNTGILRDAVLGNRTPDYDEWSRWTELSPESQSNPGTFTLTTGENDRLVFDGGDETDEVLNLPTVHKSGPADGTPELPREIETPPISANTPVSLDNPGTAYEVYLVKDGDSFWKIAQWWFGDGTKMDLIAKANPLVDPLKIKAGDKLRLPPKSSTREDASETTSGERRYVVRPGDSLATIAEKFLGSQSNWQQIYDANKSVIGSNPNAIQSGMKLRIPAG